MYSIPFYKTFCNIFEEGEQVKDVKGCVNYFLTNDSISDKILKRVASKYSNFVEKINEVLEADYTLETLIQKYKSEFLKRTIYSSTSVLYHSTVFSTSLEMLEVDEVEESSIYEEVVEEPVINTVKVGRNDPCPCGSGKKYKNCCLK